jgi:hypothetical protein
MARKLNLSGHMLIWTFYLGFVCETRAQCLSARFSYTLFSSSRLNLATDAMN